MLAFDILLPHSLDDRLDCLWMMPLLSSRTLNGQRRNVHSEWAMTAGVGTTTTLRDSSAEVLCCYDRSRRRDLLYVSPERDGPLRIARLVGQIDSLTS
jgi:hypothetical protein